LTLKALRALQSADVILYDDLVAPAIVEMARREAEKIPVGKRGYKPSCGRTISFRSWWRWHRKQARGSPQRRRSDDFWARQ